MLHHQRGVGEQVWRHSPPLQCYNATSSWKNHLFTAEQPKISEMRTICCWNQIMRSTMTLYQGCMGHPFFASGRGGAGQKTKISGRCGAGSVDISSHYRKAFSIMIIWLNLWHLEPTKPHFGSYKTFLNQCYEISAELFKLQNTWPSFADKMLSNQLFKQNWEIA